MLDFINDNDLWISVGVHLFIIGTFYFKVIRARYLEESQLRNIFYTKDEIDRKTRDTAKKSEMIELKGLVREMKLEFKEDFRALGAKIDRCLFKERI